jgi:hypothetical protein
MSDGRPGDARHDDPTEARDDALDETDVDPTGTVIRNAEVEKAEAAAAEQQASGD